MLSLRDQQLDRVANVCHVCEVHRGTETDDKDTLDPLPVGGLLDHSIFLGPRHLPQQSHLGTYRFGDHQYQGGQHSNGESDQNPQEEGPEEGKDPEEPVRPFRLPQLNRIFVPEQVHHRGQDDRPENEGGEVLECRGQNREAHKHSEAGDQAEQLCRGPDAVRDGRAGERAGHGVAGEHRTEEVHRAEREEFLAGPDLVAVQGGQGLGVGNFDHVRHDHDRDRRNDESR
mmetsp:Transcript_31589/g.77078  ORF Transcript_31589/g.77078 Transcript_31589/m.77078 type:complete len:229 (-) Transcript_31589:1598-2284(-)